MALVRNVSDLDRALRIVLGMAMGGGAWWLRHHLLGAILLAVAGLAILVEGVLGH